MTYRGRVKNGVIVLDEAASLPEGTVVDISPAEDTTDNATWGEVVEDFIGKAEGLPKDMARNHDHYIHGAPKK
jgi:hypothetical protein